MVTTEQLEQLCKDIHEIRVAYYARSFPNVSPGEITYEVGKKYARIVIADPHRSVHSFVQMDNGDLLKAASWKVPAKHARGNINDPTRNNVGPYGMAYLR